MDVGSIRHPKRRALWRNAAFIALLTLLIATVAGSHARADGPVATPYGVFVTGDTTGLNVSAVEPGLTVDLYEIADSVADPVALSDPPPGNFKHTLWGYEASLGGARLLQYTILPGVVPGPSCVPIHAAGLTVSGTHTWLPASSAMDSFTRTHRHRTDASRSEEHTSELQSHSD